MAKRFIAIFILAFSFLFIGMTFQNCAKDINIEDYSAGSQNNVDPAELIPVINSSPLNYPALIGQPMDLIVNASGPNLVYRWSKDSVALPQFTTGVLTIANVQNSDAGTYTLEVSNSYGARTVNILVTTTATVGQVAPTITSISPLQRATLTYDAGNLISVSPASLTLTVVANSAAPMSYQWYLVGTNNTLTLIAGATSASYVVNVLQGTNSGKYRVNVSNAYGSVFAETTVAFTIRNLNDCLFQVPNSKGALQTSLKVCP